MMNSIPTTFHNPISEITPSHRMVISNSEMPFSPIIKITILWSALAGYSVAFFREIVLRSNCLVQLIYQPCRPSAPYSEFDLSFCEDAFEDTAETRGILEDRVRKFKPDVILMSSWSYSHFMSLSKKLKKKGVYIIAAMDNQYRGTLKQRIGTALSPIFLKPCINSFLVAGDRQAYFAKKLGYHNVMYGLYAAEVNLFASQKPLSKRPSNFLFAGRLTEEKNIISLLEGYRSYRKMCSAPWDLNIVGTGPLKNSCGESPGVQMLGFIQPLDLPAVFEKARCFVLPSNFEPWGVVIHEAAAAGLPIIASNACGAATRFVVDGLNGYTISPHPTSIGEALLRIANKSNSELEKMSRHSTALANLWTPQKLADYFIDSLLSRLRLGAR